MSHSFMRIAERVSKRVARIEESGIRKMFEQAQKFPEAIDLSLGQPHFDALPQVKRAAMTGIKAGLNSYAPTTGLKELREAIAAKLKKRNKISAAPEQVLVTSGGSGALFLAIATLTNPGDEIIIIDPYFPLYKQVVEVFDGTPICIPSYQNFELPLDAIREAITTKTKAIIVNSPNNPTGKVYNPSDMRKVAKLAEEKNLILISDEVYEDFVYERSSLSPGSIYDGTITINSFSKCAGIPGWRVGYAVGPQDLINAMAKLQQFSFICVPRFAQVACIKALNAKLNAVINSYKRKRNLTYKILREAGFVVEKPLGAFYAFVHAPGGGEAFAARAAQEARVFITPGSVFSQRDTHFRISFAQSDKKLVQGLHALTKLKNSTLAPT